jgi:hypothetical protein
MLEWKPRLFAIVVGLAAVAASLSGTIAYFVPGNFGWGAW